MTINELLTTFAGLPVVNFAPGETPAGDPGDGTGSGGTGSGGPGDPARVAWRVAEADYDDNTEDEASPKFVAKLEAFLASPMAPVATALIIGAWGYAAVNPAPLAEICAAAPRLPSLRHLFIGDMTFEECEVSWIKQGDVTPVFAAYPDLETLRVRGTDGLELSAVRHGALRELAFESGGLPAGIVRTVAECDLPRLRHLELWLGTDNYGGDADVEDLAPILAGGRLPALEYLGLRDAEIADAVSAAVAGAPVVARLTTLDLSLGALSDVGATALLTGQPLTHLRRLDLHHHFLTEPMMARLREELEPAGVEVDLSDRQQEEDWGRFISVSE
jgi:hypothetical protein